MPGPRSLRTILPTPEERVELLSLTRSPSVAAGKSRRARIILLVADGVTLREVSRRVGVHRDVVRDWVDRYRARGVAGLADLARPGRRGRARCFALEETRIGS